jgi:hypothetical protein
MRERGRDGTETCCDRSREEIGLGNLLGAVRALEHGSQPDHTPPDLRRPNQK